MKYRQPFSGEWPITQNYGETITSSFHTGIDYGCPLGTAILASADGVIRYAGFDQTGYGTCVIIEHDLTHATLYAHLSSIRFATYGRSVKQGEVIGYSGNSGNSTGPHLHFEARSKWNDYRSHFDPFNLPIMSVDDTASFAHSEKEPDTLLKDKLKNGPVKIVAPFGAYGHNSEFTSKKVYPSGTKFVFTGNTVKHNGLTFCECQPITESCWIAVHDGETQILEENKEEEGA